MEFRELEDCYCANSHIPFFNSNSVIQLIAFVQGSMCENFILHVTNKLFSLGFNILKLFKVF